MNILAYGEDALTLWAITKKLPTILQALGDQTDPGQCQVIFRPSLGRRGGQHSSQFGEFDFILLAAEHLYLGESKWQRSSEKILDGALTLRAEQQLRHRLFTFYVQEWAFGQYASWSELEAKGSAILGSMGIIKPIAPTSSLLAANLQTILGVVQKHYPQMPLVQNVLLYFHHGPGADGLPATAGKDFKVIPLDYEEVAEANFIRLRL